MIKFLLLILLVFVEASPYALGQSTALGTGALPLFPQRSPPAPSTAALERFALMPVNEPAGIPNISIPLYEVRSGSLSLPVSISYHASGVRVADMASWVGLGWALNAGGVITRIVRGLPDEDPDGFRNHPSAVRRYRNLSIYRADDRSKMQVVANGELDMQPDLYTFNFGGYSGSFQLGNDSVYHLLPLQPLHLAPQPRGFIFTDPHGVSYTFTSHETSVTTPRAMRLDTVAWYLDRVVSADKADTIHLDYLPHTVVSESRTQQVTLVSSISRYNGHGNPTDSYYDQVNTTTQRSRRVQRIRFAGGMLTLDIPTTARLDVPSEKQLQSMTVCTARGDTIKQVRFYQSYFNQGIAQPDPADFMRLRLDSLAVRAPGLRLPPYRFAYNTTIALPNRKTGARDHWGYFNNNNGRPRTPSPTANVPLLIPTTSTTHYDLPYVYNGAFREPDTAKVQAGILRSITSPTGGRQWFTYEANTVPERYRLPNPMTTVDAEANTPCAWDDDTVKTVRTLQVPYTAAEAHCRLTINHKSPCNQQPAPPKSKGIITLTDITDPALPTTVFSRSSDVSSEPGGLFIADLPVTLEGSRQYRLSLRVIGLTDAAIQITYADQAVTYGIRNAVVGGVRVRTAHLQAAPQAPVTIKRYYYATPGSSTSSGYLLGGSTPIYQRARARLTRADGDTPTDIRPAVVTSYTTISSSPLVELSGSDRVVGYETVTVVDSASTGQTTGKTESFYRTSIDGGGGWKPPCPTVSGGWLRDQLLTRLIYAGTGHAATELVSRLENRYAMLDTLEIMGFNASADADIQIDMDRAINWENAKPFAWSTTRQTSGWMYLDQTREFRYAKGDITRYQLTTTNYRYTNMRHQQPTLVETWLGNGWRQQTWSRYAADFDTLQISATSSAATRAVRELLRSHAVASLIEQTTARASATDTLLISARLTQYQTLAPRIVLPAQHLELHTAVPLPWHSFTPAAVRAGQWTHDNRYKVQAVVDRYDAQRQVVQVHRPSDGAVGYVWDLVANQPVAVVSPAGADQLAYTSFEPTAPGTWQYAAARVQPGGQTGRWAYALYTGQDVYREGLLASTYELSFWTTGTPIVLADGAPQALPAPVLTLGAWRWYRLQVPVTNAVRLVAGATLGEMVDEVRLHPVGAHMTSYTYAPLVGMTSQTDPTGRTTTYEYDALGRLLRTRDEQGRILTQQEYRYARP